MLATKDVELAREMVRDFYSRGQLERARAIEAVLTQALAANDPPAGASPESLTPGQVARALGISLPIVERWVATGELPSTRFRGRDRVSPDAIQPLLDRLRQRQRQQPKPTAIEEALAQSQHESAVAALPHEKVARLEALIDTLQDGRRLTRGEREELAALERELPKLVGSRFSKSTRQATSGPPGP